MINVPRNLDIGKVLIAPKYKKVTKNFYFIGGGLTSRTFYEDSCEWIAIYPSDKCNEYYNLSDNFELFINGKLIHEKDGKMIRENLIMKILDNKIIDLYRIFNGVYYSFELKSFTVASSHPPTEDVTWLEYITNYIEDTMYDHHYSWCSELLFFIKEQSFMSESKYDSTFFYNEFLIKTIPTSLYDEKDIDNDENIIEVDKVENAYNAKQPINLEELDITANLGGSYLDLNTDDLLPDDPTIQYLKRRKLLKKYIRIFKEHI